MAIARALASDPKILLCDEATSALDPQTTESILQLLKDINEKLNITIVIITHQMSVVTRICKKVAIIENGILVEEGAVDEVFESPKSDAARELILDKKAEYLPVDNLKEDRNIRIVFQDNSSYEPLVANLILNFNKPVNILKADTKNVGGKARGEMILGLPAGEGLQDEMIEWIRQSGLIVTEVREDV